MRVSFPGISLVQSGTQYFFYDENVEKMVKIIENRSMRRYIEPFPCWKKWSYIELMILLSEVNNTGYSSSFLRNIILLTNEFHTKVNWLQSRDNFLKNQNECLASLRWVAIIKCYLVREFWYWNLKSKGQNIFFYFEKCDFINMINCQS